MLSLTVECLRNFAPVALDSLEAARASNDQLKVELAKELENGRLLRLLVKLAFVNERPDGDMDTQWAETGERYILKLFRDFVFHQHNDEGAPVLDWGHVSSHSINSTLGSQRKYFFSLGTSCRCSSQPC